MVPKTILAFEYGMFDDYVKFMVAVDWFTIENEETKINMKKPKYAKLVVHKL